LSKRLRRFTKVEPVHSSILDKVEEIIPETPKVEEDKAEKKEE